MDTVPNIFLKDFAHAKDPIAAVKVIKPAISDTAATILLQQYRALSSPPKEYQGASPRVWPEFDQIDDCDR